MAFVWFVIAVVVIVVVGFITSNRFTMLQFETVIKFVVVIFVCPALYAITQALAMGCGGSKPVIVSYCDA